MAFIAIAIYMLSSGADGNSRPAPPEAPPSPPSEVSQLPSAIVIDLQNLENLEKLKNLKSLGNLENLENLKNLEIELKNLDKIIEERVNSSFPEESLEKSLQQVEQKLRQIEKADFQVKLQDKKIFINKDYNVEEADWTEVNPGVFVFRESLPLPESGSMNLKMDFGNLNIVGGGDAQSELTLQATGNISSAQEIRDQLRILSDSDSESATFNIGTGSSAAGLGEKVNLEATLRIPRTLTLDVSTSGGHINATNLDGNHKLLTSGGHIMLSAISGTTRAETRGGHITGEELFGEATLKTSGGHIQVAKADVNLSASTGGGNIEIEDFSGQADAKTSGGNIIANILSASGPLNFTTSAGNINLVLPQSLGVEVNAKGNNVSLGDGLGFEGERSNGHLTGTINGGGIPLTLSCKFGNITISQN